MFRPMCSIRCETRWLHRVEGDGGLVLRIGTTVIGLCLVLLILSVCGETLLLRLLARTILLEGALVRFLCAQASYVLADMVFGINICSGGTHACNCSCYRCYCMSLAHTRCGAGERRLETRSEIQDGDDEPIGRFSMIGATTSSNYIRNGKMILEKNS
jgi:hypothetical protein